MCMRTRGRACYRKRRLCAASARRLGAVYYILPRLTGRTLIWKSRRLAPRFRISYPTFPSLAFLSPFRMRGMREFVRTLGRDLCAFDAPAKSFFFFPLPLPPTPHRHQSVFPSRLPSSRWCYVFCVVSLHSNAAVEGFKISAFCFYARITVARRKPDGSINGTIASGFQLGIRESKIEITRT